MYVYVPNTGVYQVMRGTYATNVQPKLQRKSTRQGIYARNQHLNYKQLSEVKN